LHDEGLRIVNPLRTTDISWPMITEVRSRWVLEVLHDEQRYAAWGVPADPGRPRYGRGMFSLGAAKMAQHTKETPTPAKITAQVVAAEVEARRAEDQRRKDGRTPRVLARTWDPDSVGLLLAGLAFWVFAVFLL
ncbi:MAG: PH domain-containing protein, partial [Dermatophilaceae bacterium]